jgi:hypothetical protein
MSAEVVAVADYADMFVPPPKPCHPAKGASQFLIRKNLRSSQEAHTLDDQALTRRIRLDVDDIPHLHAGEKGVKRGVTFTPPTDSSDSPFQKLFTYIFPFPISTYSINHLTVSFLRLPTSARQPPQAQGLNRGRLPYPCGSRLFLF